MLDLRFTAFAGFCLRDLGGPRRARSLPKDIVNHVSGEIAKIVRDPAIRERLAREGYESVGNTPAEQFMRDEVAKWANVIKRPASR
jgi:tripartite-type tricarboxylate transporter receptor subunit TctC